jgi:hypothetical protein
MSRAALAPLALPVLFPTSAAAADLTALQQALIRHGFQSEVRQPPGKAYGRFLPASKRLEISPLVRDLGITRPVLLHEAVHAAQSCPSGTLSLLGIKRQASPVVESRIRYLLSHHYPQAHGSLEQEAFRLQSQPDAEALIIAALNQRCQPAEE